MQRAADYIDELFESNKPEEIGLSTSVPSQQGWLKIDSADRDKTQYTPCNNFQIAKENNQYQSTGINKIAVGYVDFPWFIPNINPRNNEGKFKTQNGDEFVFTMPTGYYDLETFAPAFETALNATTVGTFTVTIGSLTTGKELVISNGTADFVPTFDLTAGKSQSLWEVAGMYKDQYVFPDNLGNEFKSRYNGYYTRYVDITSSTVNQYEKIKNESTHGPSNDLIVRIWAKADSEYYKETEIGTGGPFTRPHYVKSLSEPIKFISWEPTRTFGDNIDFRVLDEHGQLLYMGDDPVAYPDWGLSFRTQSNSQ